MSTKYEKIIFSNLDGKNKQFYYDENNKNNYLNSSGIQNDKDTKKIRLVDNFSVQNLDSPNNQELEVKLITTFSNTNARRNDNFVISEADGDDIKLYRRSDFGAYTLKFTFPSAYTNPRYALSFRNKLIIFTYNSGEYISYSTNSSDTTPTFTHTAWAYAKVKGHAVGADGYLYIIDSNGIIARTQDGITWTTYYDGATKNEHINSIETLDGYLYAIVSTRGYAENHFCRVLADELQYLKRFDNDFNLTTIKKFGERLIIADIKNGKIELHEFNKGDINKITYTDDLTFTRVSLLYADDDFIYFSASIETGLIQHNRYLYLMNKNNGIHYIKDFGAYSSAESMIGYNGKIIIQVNTFDENTPPDGVYTSKIYDNGAIPTLTIATGTIDLPIINIKHVPCYLIARHKKLSANSTLTVKAKIDDAATFATTLLTNTTDDSIEKIADLKSNKEVTRIQFQITLADSTPINGINDLELIYLYLPLGLESSK